MKNKTKPHEFYREYANLPFEKRIKFIAGTIDDPLTPDVIYQRVKKIDDEIRPKIIEKDKLIEIFEKFLSTNNNSNKGI